MTNNIHVTTLDYRTVSNPDGSSILYLAFALWSNKVETYHYQVMGFSPSGRRYVIDEGTGPRDKVLQLVRHV